jgi:hypothetical protein
MLGIRQRYVRQVKGGNSEVRVSYPVRLARSEPKMKA